MVKIVFPCKYSVNDFSPKGEGKYFCKGCNETVIDYRGKSTDNIKSKCGIFDIPRVFFNTFEFTTKVLVINTFSLFTILGIQNEAAASTISPNNQITIDSDSINKIKFPIKFSGKVVSQTGKAVVNTVILNKNNPSNRAETDENGLFTFILERADLNGIFFELILSDERFRPNSDTLSINIEEQAKIEPLVVKLQVDFTKRNKEELIISGTTNSQENNFSIKENERETPKELLELDKFDVSELVSITGGVYYDNPHTRKKSKRIKRKK